MSETQHPYDTHIADYQAWLDERPTLKEYNQDLHTLTYLLYLEVVELIEAVADGDLNEIADEAADVFNFVLSMAFLNDFDLIERGRAKIQRNHSKYPKHLFTGDLPITEAVQIAKNEWKATNNVA